MTENGADKKAKGEADAPLSRRERKKALIRQQLYETAMELFREKGFSDTTIEQITERVDVAPATFFNYFATKETVLADYHRESIESFCRYAGQLETESARERFRLMGEWQKQRALREGRLQKVLIQEFLTRPTMLKGSKEAAVALMQLLVSWVERGMETGEIRQDQDPMLIVTTVLGLWNLTMLEWAISPDCQVDCLNLSDRVSLLFDGLAPR